VDILTLGDLVADQVLEIPRLPVRWAMTLTGA
jgi:hypothetical protein